MTVLLLIAACSKLRDPQEAGTTDAVFPHPADYEAAERHGAHSLEGGHSCLACHGVETSPLETAPTCTSCHAYPHPDGWGAGAVHGAGLFGKGADTTACDACHGAADTVAGTEFACTSCHASYPHPDGWGAAGEHGVYALARGDAVAVCGPCHGADLSGGEVGVACTACHAEYPHPDTWKETHGAEYLGDPASCADCHADPEDGLWTGGRSGSACSTCHATFPHPATWRTDHAVVSDGIGEAVCLTCHTPGDGPATMVATCAERCHGGKK